MRRLLYIIFLQLSFCGLAHSANGSLQSSQPEQRSVPVYVVPMSDFPEQWAAEIAHMLSADMNIQIISTVRIGDMNLLPLPNSAQLSADEILTKASPVLRALPNVGPKTYFLLLTSRDINSTSISASSVFSWHNVDLRASVLSSARLLELKDGKPNIDAKFTRRILKMSKRAIGELYLGWTRSIDVQDVMYSPIMGIADIDRNGFEHK